MANKVKITNEQGTQVFPITHVTAVIDNNGNSVEQVLGAQTDLINQKQLEVGAVESDTVPTSGSSHWVTSGGLYDAMGSKALSVQKTQELTDVEKLKAFDNLGEAVKRYYSDWLSGINANSYSVGDTFGPSNANINTNGDFSTYGRHLHINVKEGEKYYIDKLSYNYSGQKNWYITDDDFKVLFKGTSAATNLVLTIPENGTHLFMQHNINGSTLPVVYKIIKKGDADTSTWETLTSPVRFLPVNGVTIPAIGSVATFSAWSGNYDFSCAISVSQGETYRISGLFTSNVAILDARNVCISYVEFQQGLGKWWDCENEFTVPAGGEMLLLNIINKSVKIILRRKITNQFTSVISDNIHKESAIPALAARANTTMSDALAAKRLTFAWITDTHDDKDRYRRFINYVNYYKGYINAVLHTGDSNRMSDTDGGFNATVKTYIPEIPLMNVIGNHDAHGQTRGSVQAMTSGSTLWNGTKYILPFADANCVMGTDNCYYYRDFTAQKIRVIVVNDYDRPRYVQGNGWITTTDETEIASAVEWTSSSTSYAVGAVVHYKGMYLKCTTEGTLVDDGTTYSAARVPLSKYDCACRHLGQDQVDFIISAMNVSSGWSIIFAMHEVCESFTAQHEVVSEKFSARNNLSTGVVGLKFGQNGYILQDLIAAYLNRTTLARTYKAISTNANPSSGSLVNDTTIMPDVTVDVDFSSAVGDVICFLSGHSHADGCYYSKPIQTAGKKVVQIVSATGCYIPYCQNVRFFAGDLLRGGDASKDCFNLISFDTTDKKIYLMRIGADINDALEKRDFVSISYAHT